MRVLLIKTSSMGDIIHTLPALTDAGRALPGIHFDWVVEDAFSSIPTWHPLVENVIPVALRRWRKGLFSRETWRELGQLRQYLKQQQYDIVLDAQGLAKSAFLTYFAHGVRTGLDFRSAREGLASLAYQRRCTVNFYQHAVVRMRSLFAQALGYQLPESLPDFGLKQDAFPAKQQKPYIAFLHGTTWTTKQWPEAYWIQLGELANQAGFDIKLGGGNAEEVESAMRIAKASSSAEVLPRLSIADTANLLAGATAVVAVDTGFGHLAAALDVPTVSLYGATNPAYTGALGKDSVHLAAQFGCAPCLKRSCAYQGKSDVTPACFATVPPISVWNTVRNLIKD